MAPPFARRRPPLDAETRRQRRLAWGMAILGMPMGAAINTVIGGAHSRFETVAALLMLCAWSLVVAWVIRMEWPAAADPDTESLPRVEDIPPMPPMPSALHWRSRLHATELDFRHEIDFGDTTPVPRNVEPDASGAASNEGPAP